ncbi:MAG: hypothetical protein M0Z79_05250 [Nitrospiraceae bacterium]|nr:hypothetical protein [Nitrospiraceae bacterium]
MRTMIAASEGADAENRYGFIARFAIFLMFGALMFSLTVPVSDPDFWWHVASGRWMAENRSLLDIDPFSMTFHFSEPTLSRDFILKQYWVAQLLFYLVFTVSGLHGIIVFCAAVFTLMFYVLYRLMRMSGAPVILSVLFVFLATRVIVDEFGYIGTRPQMWSSLFTVVTLYLLEMLRLKRRWAFFAIPALMLVWSNMHGGYILGDIIIVIYMAGALLFRTGDRIFYAVTASALLASGINPNGFTAFVSAPFLGPVLTSFNLLSQQQLKSMMDSVVEMQSIFEHASLMGIIRSLPFFSGIFILSIVSYAINIGNLRKIRKDHMLLFLLVLFMGVRSIRFIIFFVAVATYITAANLKIFFDSFSLPRIAAARKVALTATAVVIVALSTVYARAGIHTTGLAYENPYASDYGDVVSFMEQEHLSGNIFNDYNSGGFLIWRLSPDIKVFIDGRGLYRTAFEIFRATVDEPGTPLQGWNVPFYRKVLNDFNIDLALISGCDRVSGTLIRLAPFLAEDYAWALIYADTHTLLFMRDTPANGSFLLQHAQPKARVYESILACATEAAATGHARMMPNWELSLAVAYQGMGNTWEARRWLDDYLMRVPSDGFARGIREKMERDKR